MEPTSEQELKQLLEEGKITEEEYLDLLEAIRYRENSKLNAGETNLPISQADYRKMVPLVLSIIPWFYPIFAEVMTPAIVMIVAPLAYLSCLGSVVVAITDIRKKHEMVRPVKAALALDALFVSFAVYSAMVIPWS
jgi:hypothetical protein